MSIYWPKGSDHDYPTYDGFNPNNQDNSASPTPSSKEVRKSEMTDNSFKARNPRLYTAFKIMAVAVVFLGIAAIITVICYHKVPDFRNWVDKNILPLFHHKISLTDGIKYFGAPTVGLIAAIVLITEGVQCCQSHLARKREATEGLTSAKPKEKSGCCQKKKKPYVPIEEDWTAIR